MRLFFANTRHLKSSETNALIERMVQEKEQVAAKLLSGH
jgi:hypothetical protein